MPESRRFTFRSRPEAVSAARRALDGFEQLLDLSVFYDASLCVSELVTNAVLHAGGSDESELELEVAIVDDRLHVAVVDQGAGFDPCERNPGDESGWGLHIVDRLADRWGVERQGRTRVWFDMAVRTGLSTEASGGSTEGERSPRERADARSPRSTDDKVARVGLRSQAGL